MLVKYIVSIILMLLISSLLIFKANEVAQEYHKEIIGRTPAFDVETVYDTY